MNSLWKTILDGLTYKDLAGKRQFRAHTVIALAILILLVLVTGFALLKHIQVMNKVTAAPMPVTATTVPVEAPTTTSQANASHESGCPKDSDNWSLADVVISQNYKVIQPACVYEGLEHTVAWALAVRNGYSRAEATTALEFDSMPMRQLDHVEALGNANNPQSMPVSFVPPHPDFAEWHVDKYGNPSVTYALRGCFRTSTIVGNKVEVWGGDYPVICMVIEDAEGTQVVYALNEHIFTSPATPTRSYLLFGYAGDGLWLWLGTRENPKLPIDNPAQFAKDRLTIATLYDSHPWDMQWLKSTYGLIMRPLPKDWQYKTDEAEQQAILAALNHSGGQ